jgi:cytoskeletal protein CcmA (bactofilin family)
MLNSKDGFFGKREDTKVRKDVGNVYGMTSAPGSGGTGVTTSALSPPAASGESTAKPRSEDAQMPVAAEEPRGNRLIVGPDIKLKGEINDCDTIIVEGRVEATTDSRVLQIAQSGAFTGTVGIDVAEIRGRFQGELTARQKLVIYGTGSVSGKIRYGKLVIEEGGELTGDVSSMAAAKSAGEARSDSWQEDKKAKTAASA